MKLTELETQALLTRGHEHLVDYCILMERSWKPAWFHEKLSDALERIERGELRRLIIEMPPRAGKEMLSTTPILTGEGWKAHGDLKVGDRVFHPSGRQIKVLATIPQKEPATYEVTFSDGESVTVHGSHEWTLYDRKRRGLGKLFTMETHELFGNEWLHERGGRGSRARFQLPDIAPLTFKEQETLIDPYTFGYWLGNGTTSDNKLITFNPLTFEEVLSHIPYAPSWVYWHKTQHVPRVRFKDIPRYTGGKRIPMEYLLNSEKRRRELLAGLIDSDGHIDKTGRVHFCNTNQELIHDVSVLVRSLGYIPHMRSCPPLRSTSGIQGKKTTFTIAFVVPDGLMVSKIKQGRVRTSMRRRRSIYSVRKVKGGKGECITVDSPDGLYLAGHGLIPTHNSLLATVLFPTWYLGRHPGKHVLTASYNDTLANEFGGRARDIINSSEYRGIFPNVWLKEDSKAKGLWKTSQGGYYLSGGVGSSFTGFGGDLLILDDPFKNREEADSKTVRESKWSWFTSSFYTRQHPGAAIVVIATRWHLDDVTGRLLENEGETWERITFPAIALTDEEKRKKGDPLWPERYPLEELHLIRNAIGPYEWSALYQQQPIISEHQEFRQEFFRYFNDEDILDRKLRYYTAVDLAIGKSERADDTVITTIGKEIDGPNVYVIEQTVGHLDPAQGVDALFMHYEKYRPTKVGIESVAYQAAFSFYVQEEQRRREQYFHITELKSTQKKEERIRGLVGAYRAGVIFHRKSQTELEEQLLTFPFGKHDDCPDSLEMAIQLLEPTAYNIERKKKTFHGRITY